MFQSHRGGAAMVSGLYATVPSGRIVFSASRRAARGGLLLGLAGVIAAFALPFSPVRAQITTVTWPAPDQPVVSSTAIFVPYRPLELSASIPCPVLRAAATPAEDITILATGIDAKGLQVSAHGPDVTVAVDGHELRFSVPPSDTGCRMVIAAGPHGVRVSGLAPPSADMPGQPVPEVFGFRTALGAPDAAGMRVSAVAGEPFSTTPTPLKSVLIAVQVIAAAAAMWLLPRPRRRTRLQGRRRLWWIDLAVIAALAGWAVVGPLAVDDGWATMIARNVAATGHPGNYFRWWNAAEVPFALCEQLMAPLTTISLAPLWLRVPSTVLAVATWLVLTRGVLGAALPGIAATARVRGLAAVCLLAAWLPFNLGTRPESYVALGVTAVLMLAMRARSPAGVGWLLLAAALTVPISPTGVLVAAPILAFAPRLVAIVRAAAPTGVHLAAYGALLACVAAVGLTVIFADQSWDALAVATDWHAFFGPSLPWHEEPIRYHNLLHTDQQGSFAKRLPVLLTLAMLPVAAALSWRARNAAARATARLAAVTTVAFLLFAIVPSKWSYHLGAAAGLFAGLLTTAVVMLCRQARTPGRYSVLVGIAGSAILAATAALAFAGPNAWWLPAVYDVPWAYRSPQPLGLPLQQPLLWIGVAAAAAIAADIASRGSRTKAAVILGPALIAVTAMGTVLVLLAVSFIAAPVRRSAGSLALINADRITASRVCGLADYIQVLPDGAVLDPSGEPGEQPGGFTTRGGFAPGAAPPDPPGSATSTFLWGSRSPTGAITATTTSRWFMVPALQPDRGIAVSVSGRTDHGNALTFQFGHSDGAQVTVLGDRIPPDYPAAGEDPAHPLWRTIGVDATDLPVGANRVRIRAVDTRTDSFGRLAFTGPRLRSIVALNRFLAAHGPVLITWPQSFLFPCVHNIATVAGGLAQTPATVIESPRPWSTDDRDPHVGGSFAELAVFGDLHEIPSRLVGHPDVDWGAVLVSGDTAGRDAYQRTVTEMTVPGISGSPHERPER
jgi:arabinosyltransferase B